MSISMILSTNMTWIKAPDTTYIVTPDLVRVLPDTEILDDAMFLEDRTDVGDVDGLLARLGDESVRHSSRVILGVTSCDVYWNLLQQYRTMVISLQ